MYFLRTESELEDSVHEYSGRIMRKGHDCIDYLELMLAEEKLKNFIEFRTDVISLLKLDLKCDEKDDEID